ncbi:hypothetical protein QNH20_07710 [Neobacillus sp. WH10]|uniref:hypothetical protein n=1 Tax=Neobacillus sp. WH10 TaxID=3047873 RepID=UPI0024C14842|nr:hypothetical protein [Neobacillus sp. WH10]WHY79008.1 hypothetical protein QNH20_07710 [Neobacillus sp. WH10]
MDNHRQRRQNVPHKWMNTADHHSQRQLIDNKNNAESRSIEQDNIKIRNETINSIGQSGNSDVDIQIDVHVDTTAIAFAILCSLLATKQMNNVEFEEAVERLQSLNLRENYRYKLDDPNDLSNVKIFKRNRKRVD